MLPPLHRRSVVALALAACTILPLPLIESCGSGGPASTTGAVGTGGAGGTSSGLFITAGAGGSVPDACSGPDATDVGDGSTGCEGIEGGVTYQQAGAVLAGCTGEICHGAWTHDTVVGVPATQCCDGRFLVQPGNAAQSYLLDKVEGHDICQGVRMPFDLPPLTNTDTLTLVQWICEGAPGQ
jgi:hypothetical protein